MATKVSGGGVTLSFDKGQIAWLENAMKDLSPEKRDGVIERGLQKVAFAVKNELVDRTLRGGSLAVRSGRLRQSIGALVTRRGKDLIGVIGSGVLSGKRVKYANIHETGGVVRPTNSKYLAIPFGKALTPAGVARFKPRDIEKFYDSSAVFKSKRGALIIWGIETLAKKTKATPLFLLKPSVNIPDRGYMSKTVKKVAPAAVGIMLKEIEKEVKKA